MAACPVRSLRLARALVGRAVLLLCLPVGCGHAPPVLSASEGRLSCRGLSCGGDACAAIAVERRALAPGVALTCDPAGLTICASPGASPGVVSGVCGPLQLTVRIE
jgi:hypothetical protein